MQTTLHPLLVHLPIALAVLLPALTGILWFALVRSWLPLRAWALAVGAQALLLGSGWLAMQSGEADEDLVERIVPEAALEAHEAAAERFLFGAGAVLLLSLVPLLGRRNPRLATWSAGATCVATLGVLALGYGVGKAGGELVYRHGAAAAFATPGAQPVGTGAPRRREDDDH